MKNLLVFLGDHILRENIGEVLRLEGYNVIPAIGIKNLNVIKMINPDLIIFDVKQPWMNGRDLLTELRSSESTKNIKFIFIDSKKYSAERNVLKENGADAFLTIPFSLTEMLLTLTSLLRA